MSQTIIATLALAVLGGIAGAVALVLKMAKKAGQKQAEADYEARNARDAKAAGTAVAEHRSRDDVARRLRDGNF